GKATNNENDPGSYNITVAAANNCGVEAKTYFTLTVAANKWCGDGIVQGEYGELCDDNQNCSSNCVCNAGWVDCDGEETDADGCECNISGGNICWDGDCCTPDTCAFECGTYSNNCGGTINCGACVNANTHCSAGSCICDDGWQDCDGNDSCECSGWCSGLTCCTSAENVNIQVCVDNAHTTYFNGVFVSSAANWGSVQAYNVNVISGKNVIAIKGSDWGALYGISATLNWPGCVNMTTAEINKWKCTTTLGAGWTNINYDDSSWPTAVFGNPGTAGIRAGNFLTVPQIWASGAGAGSTVYCRYTFGE
ncbi:MAG: hypothetical protein U9M94_02505, partial [Patescibacteria group bacterium]|nr:hypothetical protein [Patescibacteria group bacterium]